MQLKIRTLAKSNKKTLISGIPRVPPPVVNWRDIRGNPKTPKSSDFWTICFGNLAKKHYEFSGRLRRPERSNTRGGNKPEEYH